MTRLCVTVPVDLQSPPWNHRYLDSDGNTCTWLHVGADGELGLYGTLDAMRRLGDAVLAAATEPDTRSTAQVARGPHRTPDDKQSRGAGGDAP
jgi:hypothetical protein